MVANSVVVALALAASSVSGFFIPEGQPDGLYLYNKNGSAEHTRLAGVPSFTEKMMKRELAVNAGKASVSKRDFVPDRLGCTQGTVTSLDYTQASNALKSTCQFEPTYQSGEHAYAVSGGCVMYMCNYGGQNPCSDDELTQALSLIAPECPGYRTGWAVSDTYAKSYGYDTTIGDICTNIGA